MAVLPDYLDRDGFVRYWTLMRDGDDVLTSYILSIAHEAGYAIPERERQRMEQALVAFVEGRVIRNSALPTLFPRRPSRLSTARRQRTRCPGRGHSARQTDRH